MGKSRKAISVLRAESLLSGGCMTKWLQLPQPTCRSELRVFTPPQVETFKGKEPKASEKPQAVATKESG